MLEEAAELVFPIFFLGVRYVTIYVHMYVGVWWWEQLGSVIA